MKKYLLVLGMIACLFGLTACSAEKEKAEPLMSKEDAAANASELVDNLMGIAAMPEEYQSDIINSILTEGGYDASSVSAVIKTVEKAVESFNNAKGDMGDYIEIIDSEVVTLEEEEAVINVTVKGSIRNAVVEVIYEETATGYVVTSVAANVKYTFGESMQRAGLNTLLGMGTVFVVLILISLLISCFRFISVFEKKEEPKKEAAKPAPVVTETVQTVEEDLTDDLELVAVIAAAIAASEGAATTDGFVVRSIRKANKSKWQKA